MQKKARIFTCAMRMLHGDDTPRNAARRHAASRMKGDARAYISRFRANNDIFRRFDTFTQGRRRYIIITPPRQRAGSSTMPMNYRRSCSHISRFHR